MFGGKRIIHRHQIHFCPGGQVGTDTIMAGKAAHHKTAPVKIQDSGLTLFYICRIIPAHRNSIRTIRNWFYHIIFCGQPGWIGYSKSRTHLFIITAHFLQVGRCAALGVTACGSGDKRQNFCIQQLIIFCPGHDSSSLSYQRKKQKVCCFLRASLNPFFCIRSQKADCPVKPYISGCNSITIFFKPAKSRAVK